MSENEYNLFLCRLCEGVEPMDVKTFKAHRESVHQLTTHGGRKRMTLHMDARDWHETTYEWRNPEPDDTIFAIQTVRVPRRKDDLLYDMGGYAARGKRGKK